VIQGEGRTSAESEKELWEEDNAHKGKTSKEKDDVDDAYFFNVFLLKLIDHGLIDVFQLLLQLVMRRHRDALKSTRLSPLHEFTVCEVLVTDELQPEHPLLSAMSVNKIAYSP
jgi:hypothetical protein